MKNYAEELAYLYFRLNGFFLIDNYVSHAKENHSTWHADNDLLGIKPPHVSELVGLKKSSDFSFYKDLKIDSKDCKNKWVGVICECKAGQSRSRNLTNNKLEPCIKRLGLINENKIGLAVDKLMKSDTYTDKNILIIKVLVSRFDQNNIKNYKKLSTKKIIKFIRKRIKKHPDKNKAWNHNGSQILQLLLTEKIKLSNEASV